MTCPLRSHGRGCDDATNITIDGGIPTQILVQGSSGMVTLTDGFHAVNFVDQVTDAIFAFVNSDVGKTRNADSNAFQ